MIDPVSYGVSFVAGALSILSPCVLPLVPILFGTATSTHRWGPYILIGGLVVSFTLIGVALGSLGASLGVEPEVLRQVGALVLLILGLVLLSVYLQQHFSAAIARLGVGQNLFAGGKFHGLPGQFGLGLLLGAVWSPCVGPTLGVAITLASQGESLPQVSVIMLLFSLGTALPLLVLSVASRQVMMKWRNRMLVAGQMGKRLFGFALVTIGAMILTGADKTVEGWLVAVMPDSLVTLTTRY